MGIERIARAIGWTLVGLVLLVVGLYGVLVMVNWRDEAPSADAQRLTQVIDSRPNVPDAENAFVFVLGLAATPDQGPVALGTMRREFLEDFEPGTSGPVDAIVPLPGNEVDYKALRSPTIVAFVTACREREPACLQSLQRDAAEIDRWLASEAWLLDRYQQLLQRRRWVETFPTDPQGPTPIYGDALEGQVLLLSTAFRHAQAGEGDAARELLARDLAFWRMVLRSSDLLIAKMIATAAITRHFWMGNLVLRELHATGHPIAPPASWREPISAAERSMLRTLAGEWRYATSRLGDWFPRRAAIDHPRQWRLMQPLLKVQATTNVYASHMLQVSERVAVDYRSLPELVHSPWQTEAEKQIFEPRLYNPVAPLTLLGGMTTNFTHYAVRVSDLEGVRRSALLATELRAVPADATTVEARVKSASLRDPYTGLPFAWDGTSRSILFNGLAEGARGRHAMPL